jgi:hypothetical protein
MTEDDLLASVLELAAALHVLAYHTRDSRRSTSPGFPDLVLAGRRGVIFAELKSAGGSMRADQLTWKYELLASGQKWRLYRPADWTTGVIKSDLKDLA